jgi:hypothetical protein
LKSAYRNNDLNPEEYDPHQQEFFIPPLGIIRMNSQAESPTASLSASPGPILGAWTCHRDFEGTTINFPSIEVIDRLICLRILCHLHKCEALGSAGHSIRDEIHRDDFPNGCEKLLQLGFCGGITQVANVKFLRH